MYRIVSRPIPPPPCKQAIPYTRHRTPRLVSPAHSAVARKIRLRGMVSSIDSANDIGSPSSEDFCGERQMDKALSGIRVIDMTRSFDHSA